MIEIAELGLRSFEQPPGMPFFDCEQGSPEWFELRRGIPTCSEFSKIVAKKGPRGGTSHPEFVGRTKYLRLLAAERISGEVEFGWEGNRHTERGKEREDEARALYALRENADLLRVGFVRNDEVGAGCSPDSFVEHSGLAVGVVEIKDAIGSIQVERLVAGVIPSEHRWQCVGALLVCDPIMWVDYVSHCRGLPPLIVRMNRAEVTAELAELSDALAAFNEELAALVRWLEAMR